MQGQKDPLEKGLQSIPVFLPGEFYEQKNLVGYSPWGREESDTTEQLTLHNWDPLMLGSTDAVCKGLGWV